MSSDDESHMAVDLSDDEEVQYEEDDQGEDDVGGEDEPGSEVSEESDDENNSLVMPQRKVRSVAPVWLPVPSVYTTWTTLLSIRAGMLASLL